VGRTGEPLTVEQILAWADAHHEQTGRWPRAGSGVVVGTAAETWAALDSALHHGGRGLPGGSSLTHLLEEQRGVHGRGPWTPQEDKLVRTLPALEVSHRTGRSLGAVYKRRRQLGVPTAQHGPTPRDWTAKEDEMVRSLPALAVAHRTGRSLTAVYLRRRQLGLRRR
jgi:hypothetical protein